MSHIQYDIKAVFDSLPIACAVILPDQPTFTVAGLNRLYLEFVNEEKVNILGTGLFDKIGSKFEPAGQDGLRRIQESLKTVVAEKKEHASEIRIHPGSGHGDDTDDEKWLFLHSPVLDEKGELLYILQTRQVMTGQKSELEKQGVREKQLAEEYSVGIKSDLQAMNILLEGQIAKKNTQFEAASKELDDFVYSVSHDLRAPLRRINGFSQELLAEHSGSLNETGTHYLNRICKGARDMGVLIDDLLKLSKISRKKINFETIHLSELVGELSKDLIEQESGRVIETKIEEGLTVKADRGLIKVLLTNLLSNAIKFTKHKARAIIEFGSKSVAGKAYFFVKDNGAGFDPAYYEKLFQAFQRLHSEKEFEGTGIGLATVKRIVHLHGGEIWAESLPDQGAEFYFNLDTNGDHDE